MKWPGREADHSTPYSADIKKVWSYTSTLPYSFKACTRETLHMWKSIMKSLAVSSINF